MRRSSGSSKLVGAIRNTKKIPNASASALKQKPPIVGVSSAQEFRHPQLPPPLGWKPLYDAVVKARKSIEAPVDTIGCSKLQQAGDSKEDKRYQTLLALMLSAQTRDQMTAKAMENLFEYGCSPKNIDRLPVDSLKDKISMVGFANKKAEYIKRTTQAILEDHDGVIPDTVKELCKFSGVGPKMAHLFVQAADGAVEGIGVDTHVHRIAQRWNWVSKQVDPSLAGRTADSFTAEDTRKTLEKWLPREHWADVNEVLVGWGQKMCLPRFPKCSECPAASLCPAAFTEESEAQRKRRVSRENSEASIAGTPGAKGKKNPPVLDIEDSPGTVIRTTPRSTSRSRVVGAKDATSGLHRESGSSQSPSRKKARTEAPSATTASKQRNVTAI